MLTNENVQGNDTMQDQPAHGEIERRLLFKTAGAGIAGAAAMSALSAGGVALSGSSASAQTTP
ncbi:hypothetical protein, partial [Caulobacter sp. S45]|uniref:hypothetical protein n=1 Tax=Caulobacter sp. S45 TaxID=1641861 RepID=UPI001C2DCBC7